MCVSTKPGPEDEAEEGLGGLPSNISSVSSLLLFNTTENLYGRAVEREAGRPRVVSEPRRAADSDTPLAIGTKNMSSLTHWPVL